MFSSSSSSLLTKNNKSSGECSLQTKPNLGYVCRLASAAWVEQNEFGQIEQNVAVLRPQTSQWCQGQVHCPVNKERRGKLTRSTSCWLNTLLLDFTSWWSFEVKTGQMVNFAARFHIAHHEVSALRTTEAKVFSLGFFLNFTVLLLLNLFYLHWFCELIFYLKPRPRRKLL